MLFITIRSERRRVGPEQKVSSLGRHRIRLLPPLSPSARACACVRAFVRGCAGTASIHTFSTSEEAAEEEEEEQEQEQEQVRGESPDGRYNFGISAPPPRPPAMSCDASRKSHRKSSAPAVCIPAPLVFFAFSLT